ncbi:transposase [Streptomyces sp. NPDC055287]
MVDWGRPTISELLSVSDCIGADGRCRLLSLVVTPAQRADCTQFNPVMAEIRVPKPGPGRPRKKPESMAADKAYSNKSCHEYLRRRGVRHTIPEKTDSQAARLRKGSHGGRHQASTKSGTRCATPSNGPSTGSSSAGRRHSESVQAVKVPYVGRRPGAWRIRPPATGRHRHSDQVRRAHGRTWVRLPARRRTAPSIRRASCSTWPTWGRCARGRWALEAVASAKARDRSEPTDDRRSPPPQGRALHEAIAGTGGSMTGALPGGREARLRDTRARLQSDVDLWAATSGSGGVHLIALSYLGDGIACFISTPCASVAGRNVLADGRVRLSLGPTATWSSSTAAPSRRHRPPRPPRPAARRAAAPKPASCSVWPRWPYGSAPEGIELQQVDLATAASPSAPPTTQSRPLSLSASGGRQRCLRDRFDPC